MLLNVVFTGPRIFSQEVLEKRVSLSPIIVEFFRTFDSNILDQDETEIKIETLLQHFKKVSDLHMIQAENELTGLPHTDLGLMAASLFIPRIQQDFDTSVEFELFYVEKRLYLHVILITIHGARQTLNTVYEWRF